MSNLPTQQTTTGQPVGGAPVQSGMAAPPAGPAGAHALRAQQLTQQAEAARAQGDYGTFLASETKGELNML